MPLMTAHRLIWTRYPCGGGRIGKGKGHKSRAWNQRDDDVCRKVALTDDIVQPFICLFIDLASKRSNEKKNVDESLKERLGYASFITKVAMRVNLETIPSRWSLMTIDGEWRLGIMIRDRGW